MLLAVYSRLNKTSFCAGSLLLKCLPGYNMLKFHADASQIVCTTLSDLDHVPNKAYLATTEPCTFYHWLHL